MTLILILALVAPALAQTPTPEVKDWHKEMSRSHPKKKGCFTSSYPDREWKEVPCNTTAPPIPYRPSHGAAIPDAIGNGTDVSAHIASGEIAETIGSFDSVTGVSSEVGTNPYTAMSNQPNTYSLQINSQFFTDPPECSGAANPAVCQGWQQFVYSSDSSFPLLYMQYWMINYSATCPGGWIKDGSDCYSNSNAINMPQEVIGNLSTMSLTGTAVSGGNDTIILAVGATLYSANGLDTVLGLATVWNTSEFNIVGDGNGTQAIFNAGSSLVVRTATSYGSNRSPSCLGSGTTGETNNLNFASPPASVAGSLPAVAFTESTSGASGACASSILIDAQPSGGMMQFLLKRDCDPASNDDTPVGLNKAA